MPFKTVWSLWKMCLSPKRLPLQIINNSVNYQKYSFHFFLSCFGSGWWSVLSRRGYTHSYKKYITVSILTIAKADFTDITIGSRSICVSFYIFKISVNISKGAGYDILDPLLVCVLAGKGGRGGRGNSKLDSLWFIDGAKV